MIVVLGSEGGLGWWRAVAALGKPAHAYFRPANREAEEPPMQKGALASLMETYIA
jgi:hypothetical protein